MWLHRVGEILEQARLVVPPRFGSLGLSLGARGGVRLRTPSASRDVHAPDEDLSLGLTGADPNPLSVGEMQFANSHSGPLSDTKALC